MATVRERIEALEEDVVVQRVVLESLDDQDFAGVDEERREARKELERLKRQLRMAKQQRQDEERDEEREEQEEEQAAHGGGCGSGSGSGREPPTPSKKAPNHQADSGPSSARKKPQTPTKMSSQGANIWGTPGSQSLPSRKRRFDSTALDGQFGASKNPRTTPVPSDPFMLSPAGHSNVSNGSIDFVDLTGDDNDWLPNEVSAPQVEMANRYRQELLDRDLAQRLSAQYDMHNIATPQSNNISNDAFAMMMGQNPSNFVTSQLTSDGQERETDTAPSIEPDFPAMHMPGAYHPSWDEHLSPLPAATVQSPNTSLVNNGYAPSVPAQMASTYTQPAYQTQNENFIPGMNMDNWALALGSQASPNALQGLYPNGQQYGSFSSQQPSPLPMPSTGSSLADIINLTSTFSQTGYEDPRVTSALQDAYHDPRMTDQDLDNLLQNIRPDMDIPEGNRDGTPEALVKPLYPHQELALTWMKKMEQGSNRGGILADDMGLGKTISTLALMHSRKSTDARHKTNLIVGPVALIRQWEEEIMSKTKHSHRLSAFVFHNKKMSTSDLLKYDVILTTYGTIAQELKRLEKIIEDNEGRNIDWNDKAIALKIPLLHPRKANFYRIILDEAQCIKNKDTQTAKACHKLQATYRWCLTGTPMMNGVLELFSLLHFLRIKPYSVWEEFRRAFGVLFGRNGDSKSTAMRRLRALLKAIMLRRKKNSELNGKPILRLPEKVEEVVYAELTTEERDFYDQLEKKSQVQFSKYLRAGSIGKNYSNILVLLLRLRQACCHPHLNLDVEDTASPVTTEEKLALVKELDTAIVQRIKAIESFECPICYDAVQCPSFFIPCGHDSCNECLCRLTENAAANNLREGNESTRTRCPVCRRPFEPSKCFTYEAFQQVHMPKSISKSEPGIEVSEDGDLDDGDDSETDFSSDDEVDNQGNLKGFIVKDDELDEDQGTQSARKAKKKAKGKKKALDIKPSMLKTLRKDACKNREAFKKYMRYLRKTWLPAAKVSECMNLLKEIEKTGEKTIIFSQWTLLLDLLEVAMWHGKFERKPRRYDGSMTAVERDIAAKAFRDDRRVNVMLVSLRAGNAGLNLTAASRVIMMDPFWNPYIEMQAVDRAYRIGQQKEVKVYRILTKETVEDRIVALQDKKKEMVEAALDENESAKIGRLGVNELKFLFNAG